jgi:hypothetical protein
MADEKEDNFEDLPEYNNLETLVSPTNTESSTYESSTEKDTSSSSSSKVETKTSATSSTSFTKILTLTSTSAAVVITGSGLIGINVISNAPTANVSIMDLEDNSFTYNFTTTNNDGRKVYFTFGTKEAIDQKIDVSTANTYSGTFSDLAYSTTYTAKIYYESNGSNTSLYSKDFTVMDNPNTSTIFRLSALKLYGLVLDYSFTIENPDDHQVTFYLYQGEEEVNSLDISEAKDYSGMLTDLEGSTDYEVKIISDDKAGHTLTIYAKSFTTIASPLTMNTLSSTGKTINYDFTIANPDNYTLTFNIYAVMTNDGQTFDERIYKIDCSKDNTYKGTVDYTYGETYRTEVTATVDNEDIWFYSHINQTLALPSIEVILAQMDEISFYFKCKVTNPDNYFTITYTLKSPYDTIFTHDISKEKTYDFDPNIYSENLALDYNTKYTLTITASPANPSADEDLKVIYTNTYSTPSQETPST